MNKVMPVAQNIRQFILTQFPPARRRTLLDTDPLLQSGIIDSLGVLDVVTFIESEFKITVDDDDLLPEHFESIEHITAFVEKKAQRQAGA
jgi:acyl carrier protein